MSDILRATLVRVCPWSLCAHTPPFSCTGPQLTISWKWQYRKRDAVVSGCSISQKLGGAPGAYWPVATFTASGVSCVKPPSLLRTAGFQGAPCPRLGAEVNVPGSSEVESSSGRLAAPTERSSREQKRTILSEKHRVFWNAVGTFTLAEVVRSVSPHAAVAFTFVDVTKSNPFLGRR